MRSGHKSLPWSRSRRSRGVCPHPHTLLRCWPARLLPYPHALSGHRLRRHPLAPRAKESSAEEASAHAATCRRDACDEEQRCQRAMPRPAPSLPRLATKPPWPLRPHAASWGRARPGQRRKNRRRPIAPRERLPASTGPALAMHRPRVPQP